jgi:hypothetical protein
VLVSCPLSAVRPRACCTMLQRMLYDAAAHVVQCCSTYCTMLQHVLYDVAAHIVRWCSTCCTMLQHMLYDVAAHVVRCCSACCTMLQRSAVPGSVGAGAVRQAVPGLPRAGLARVLRVRPLATSAPGLGAFCHICTGTGRTLPHLHRDWAHPATSAPGLGAPCHICTGTGLARLSLASALVARARLGSLTGDLLLFCSRTTAPHCAFGYADGCRKCPVRPQLHGVWCIFCGGCCMLTPVTRSVCPVLNRPTSSPGPAHILPGTGPHPPRDVGLSASTCNATRDPLGSPPQHLHQDWV